MTLINKTKFYILLFDCKHRNIDAHLPFVCITDNALRSFTIWFVYVVVYRVKGAGSVSLKRVVYVVLSEIT
jgi:hypothetical protein